MQDLFDGSRKDSLRLQLLGWGDKLSEIFNAAIELGLFTKVSEGADTVPAIAEALDIPQGTVKSRLFRGRLALRQVLSKLCPDTAPSVDKR